MHGQNHIKIPNIFSTVSFYLLCLKFPLSKRLPYSNKLCLQGNTHLGSPTSRRDDNIITDLQKIRCEIIDVVYHTSPPNKKLNTRVRGRLQYFWFKFHVTLPRRNCHIFQTLNRRTTKCISPQQKLLLPAPQPYDRHVGMNHH